MRNAGSLTDVLGVLPRQLKLTYDIPCKLLFHGLVRAAVANGSSLILQLLLLVLLAQQRRLGRQSNRHVEPVSAGCTDLQFNNGTSKAAHFVSSLQEAFEPRE